MSGDLSRIPPHDARAEQAVLCGVLVRPEVIADVVTVCDGDDFYQLKNQRVFEAMVRLWSESSPIDAITVIDALRRAGDFDRGVDDKYVLEIAASNIDVPAMAPVHARIVHELSLKRGLAAMAADLASAAIDGDGDSTTLISEVSKSSISCASAKRAEANRRRTIYAKRLSISTISRRMPSPPDLMA